MCFVLHYEVKRNPCCPFLTTLVSGSPFIQDGKLIGAVTHVLVNDPEHGYGICIENMLKSAYDASRQTESRKLAA